MNNGSARSLLSLFLLSILALALMLLTALGVYYIAAPWFLPRSSSASAPPAASLSAGAAAPTPASAAPAAGSASLAVPLTSAQQAQQQREDTRFPFYSKLLQQSAGAINSAQEQKGEPATLQLFFTGSNPAVVQQALNVLVLPDAYQYGFNHIRIYLPDPSNLAEGDRLYEEANRSADGSWQLFLR